MTKTVIARAPGRINLIGEHTDYNDGWVLPAAIEKCTTVTLQLQTDGHISSIRSDIMGEAPGLDMNNPDPGLPGWWRSLYGIVVLLIRKGYSIAPFDASIESDIPVGAGVSSSAALQSAFILSLAELFNLPLGKLDMALLCQEADHEFVGIQSGIMDQYASLFGKKGCFIHLDCHQLTHRYVPWQEEDVEIVLVDSRVSHKLADSEYNTRRQECTKALDLIQQHVPQWDSFRRIDPQHLDQIKEWVPKTLYQRVRHVVTENRRVKKMVDILTGTDNGHVGELLFDSHKSLKNDYAVSCNELDFLVDTARSSSHVYGSRMMGGGFGGCTINLVEKQGVEIFRNAISSAYFKTFGVHPGFMACRPSAGAQII